MTDHHIPQFKSCFMFSSIEELYSVFNEMHAIH